MQFLAGLGSAGLHIPAEPSARPILRPSPTPAFAVRTADFIENPTKSPPIYNQVAPIYPQGVVTDPLRQNMVDILDRARGRASGLVDALERVSPDNRSDAMRKAFDSWRGGGAQRIRERMVHLIARGWPVRPALHEAIALEIASTVMTRATDDTIRVAEGRPASAALASTSVDGLTGLGYSLSELWEDTKEVAGDVKDFVQETAATIADVLCSEGAAIAATVTGAIVGGVYSGGSGVTAGAAGGRATAEAGQQSACSTARDVSNAVGSPLQEKIKRLLRAYPRTVWQIAILDDLQPGLGSALLKNKLDGGGTDRQISNAIHNEYRALIGEWGARQATAGKAWVKRIAALGLNPADMYRDAAKFGVHPDQAWAAGKRSGFSPLFKEEMVAWFRARGNPMQHAFQRQMWSMAASDIARLRSMLPERGENPLIDQHVGEVIDAAWLRFCVQDITLAQAAERVRAGLREYIARYGPGGIWYDRSIRGAGQPSGGGRPDGSRPPAPKKESGGGGILVVGGLIAALAMGAKGG